ncbi:hypothetical protein [Maricaulis sp.]|uniref:hypothetical protein n=1 Tax=Maricaulis sp. TaxID=1486257 RepID=UPI003A9440A4
MATAEEKKASRRLAYDEYVKQHGIGALKHAMEAATQEQVRLDLKHSVSSYPAIEIAAYIDEYDKAEAADHKAEQRNYETDRDKHTRLAAYGALVLGLANLVWNIAKG